MRGFAGETPPPGAYDPKFENKIKGLVIEKCDRFMDTRSTCSAEWNTTIAGKNSGNISASIFRVVKIAANFVINQANLISKIKF